MDIPAMFGRAVAEFDARVAQIGDDQWQAATPDEDWMVRDLVNHLVGEDLWAPPLLAGSTIAEVGDRFEGDVLGSEPKAAWAAASAAAVRAVQADGAMDRIAARAEPDRRRCGGHAVTSRPPGSGTRSVRSGPASSSASALGARTPVALREYATRAAHLFCPSAAQREESTQGAHSGSPVCLSAC
jgi:Mycothiol maleylpyruvate isomerase N-terminal domain